MNKVKNIFAHTDCLSEEMLAKYISDELSFAQKHEVEKHLVDCAMCSDAVEGLRAIDPKKIPSVTSGLNRKIQDRAEKREAKIVFIRHYRTQLAVAASIVLILGLVWFFRNNIPMTKMDSASAEKMFADKFEPYPSEQEKNSIEQSVQAGKEENAPVLPEPRDIIPDGKKIKESVANVDNRPETSKNTSGDESLILTEATSHSKQDFRKTDADQVQSEIPAEEKQREESIDENTGDDINIAETSMKQKKSELLKEKGIKGEVEKSGPVSSMTSSGAKIQVYGQPAKDEMTALEKQNANKVIEDKKRSEDRISNSTRSAEVDVLAVESKKKAERKSPKKDKEMMPKKNWGGEYEVQTTVPATATPVRSQTKTGINSTLDSVSPENVSAVIAAGEITVMDGALLKYEKQDYAGAIHDFELALKQNPNDEKALFYSAVSYLSVGQTDKAVTNFNKVMQNKNGEYYDAAQWYVSLAYIKNNDTKNARRNLEELQNNSRSRYQKQADETLKEITK